MKKITLLFPVLLMSTSLIAGCDVIKKEEHLTYGTYVTTTATDLKYNELAKKMLGGDEQGENFLLAVYYGKDSHCSCWGTFKNVLNEYVTKYNNVVYTIDRFEFNSFNEANAKKWGLSLMNRDEPYFYIVTNGKVKKEYLYKSGAKMFKNVDALNNEISSIIKNANMYYIEQDELDNRMMEEKKETIVHYIWSFCPDCEYCSPHCLYPYVNNKTLKNPIYVLDIGHLTGYDPTSANPFMNFSTSNPEYVSFLKEHKMSLKGDETLGYDRGVVPTTQVWKDGKLIDSNVYLNDEIEKKDDKYIVTQSFFSNDRINNLHYLDGVKTKVIEGMEVKEADIIKNGDSYSWDKDAASVYHNPLLEAFLDTYAK